MQIQIQLQRRFIKSPLLRTNNKKKMFPFLTLLSQPKYMSLAISITGGFGIPFVLFQSRNWIFSQRKNWISLFLILQFVRRGVAWKINLSVEVHMLNAILQTNKKKHFIQDVHCWWTLEWKCSKVVFALRRWKLGMGSWNASSTSSIHPTPPSLRSDPIFAPFLPCYYIFCQAQVLLYQSTKYLLYPITSMLQYFFSQ